MERPKAVAGALDRFRDKLVTYLLALRGEYLKAGASPLKHWEQMQTRILSGVKTSGNLAEFGTALQRSLLLASVGNSASSALLDLCQYAAELEEDTGYSEARLLGIVESQLGLIMAEMRLEAERRKAEREAAQEVGSDG